MATFTLPANSKINGKGRVHKADGATKVKKFTVYRYDPDSGENPATTRSRSIWTSAAPWCWTRCSRSRTRWTRP
jgi:hypothetical protein